MAKYTLLPKQKEFFEIPHDNELDVCLYQGGYTCVPCDAEYLSPYGWRKIDTLTKEDKLAVYYDDGSIKFEHPKEVFKWDADYWYEFHTRTLHQKLCPNHKVVTWQEGKKRIQTMAEYYDEHQRLRAGHRGRFRTTAFVNNHSLNLDENIIRFIVAYQADGTKVKDGVARFHLSKQRKIDRLIGILQAIGVKYEHKVYADSDSYIIVETQDNYLIKEFPEYLYQLDSSVLKLIVDECKFWDGTEGDKHNSYYTSIKANADFIQFAGTMSGYRTTIFSRTRINTKGIPVAEYRVNFNTNTEPNLYATRNKATITKAKALEGEYKYCPSTTSGMWLMRYDNKIVVTGNSGKTWCGSLLGILLARKYPGSRGLVGAKEYELVRKTTLEEYFNHLDKMGYIKGLDYTYNKIDKIIRFTNGSEILFSALDDPERFKSLNLHWAEIEEASQVSDASFKQLLGRLRNTYRGKNWPEFKYRLFAHTNPQASKGWIWKRFVENPKDNFRLVLAPTSENKYLPAHFVESLKEEYDEEYYRINVLGEFGNYSSGLVVKHFSDDNIKEIDYNPNDVLHLTCDFNVDPMCWGIAHRDEDNIYFFDELVIENTNTQQCIEEFIRRYPNHKNTIVVTGDASGDYRSAQSEFTNYMIIKRALEAHGYNVEFKLRQFNPAIMKRIQAFNARIRNAKGECHLFIDKRRCKWIMHNMYNLSFKEGTSIVKVPTEKEIKNDRDAKFLEHPFDAISYLVEFYHPIK